MPSGGTPILAAESLDAGVTDWIEATVEFSPSTPAPYPDTLLTRLATGPRRLWLLAGGAMCVFMGLMLGPTLVRPCSEKVGRTDARVPALANVIEDGPEAVDDDGVIDGELVEQDESTIWGGEEIDFEELNETGATDKECTEMELEGAGGSAPEMNQR